MNAAIIAQLNALNRDFYRVAGEDFDRTRGKPWPGWARLLPYLRLDTVPDSPGGLPSNTPTSATRSVLDVGCGNGRFGAFLIEVLTPHSPLSEGEGKTMTIRYHGLDSDPALLAKARVKLTSAGAKRASPLPVRVDVRLEQRDIVENPPDAGAYDLVALFGVLHHIPGSATRLALLRALAERVAPGGLLAFSCWRFYEDGRLRARIVPWPDDLAARVEAGDYLLDWRRGQPALRYCHYVDDAEHTALVGATGLAEIESYRADGRTGNLNRYSLLQKV
jgi:SAM-dependent methyltransferase